MFVSRKVLPHFFFWEIVTKCLCFGKSVIQKCHVGHGFHLPWTIHHRPVNIFFSFLHLEQFLGINHTTPTADYPRLGMRGTFILLITIFNLPTVGYFCYLCVMFCGSLCFPLPICYACTSFSIQKDHAGIHNPVKRFKALSHLEYLPCDTALLQTHRSKEESFKSN